MSRLPFFQANLRKKVKKMLIATILLQQRKKTETKITCLIYKNFVFVQGSKKHNEITQCSQAKHFEDQRYLTPGSLHTLSPGFLKKHTLY